MKQKQKTTQHNSFKQIFRDMKVDSKTFKSTWLYGIVWFGAIFAFFNLFLITFEKSIGSLTSVISTQSSAALIGIVIGALAFVILAIVAIAYITAFAENLIWSTIIKKKVTFGNTTSFLFFGILMAIVVTIIGLIGYGIYTIFFNINWPQTGIFIFSLVIIYCVYLYAVGLIAFAKKEKIFRSIKHAITIGTKELKHTYLNIIVALLAGFIVNIAGSPLLLFPEWIYLTLFAVIAAGYLAWARIYFANALKSI